MKNRRNKDLHVVRDTEDPTDKIVERIMNELGSEDDPMKDMEEQIKQHKMRFRRRVIISTVAVVAIAIGIYLLINLQTYTNARITDTYTSQDAENNNYIQFADGVLKYSRDGAAYLNQSGEEEWNQSYQIQNPIVDIYEDSVVIADKGGNDIEVLQKDGPKGQVHTTLPIEKVTVSAQGIVGVVLKNDSAARVMCYDLAGNVLVEHKASWSGTGYPVDIAMAEDGETMQVLYLYLNESKVTSKVVYYNFGEAGQEKTDHQVASADFEDTVMADGFFLNSNTSVAIGDNHMVIYQGTDEPEKVAEVEIDKEIKSIFHNDRYVGMILRNEGKRGYELRLYSAGGRVVQSKDFTGEYDNVKLCGGQVIMYDGNKCAIFMRSGVQKFEGELETPIMEMFPVAGVNRYIVMNANGMQKVRLVK